MNAMRRSLGWLFPKQKPRLPFLGVFLVAAAGCGIGQLSPWSPLWSAVPAALLLALTMLSGFSFPFWTGLFLSFVALQSAQQQWGGSKRLVDRFAELPVVLEVQGIVREPPQPSGNAWRFQLKLIEGGVPGRLPEKLDGIVSVRWPGEPPSYGDLVSVRGSLRKVPGPRNPGEFDFAQWMRWRGVWAELRAPTAADANVLASGRGNPIRALALETRAHIAKLLGEGIGQFPEVRALLLAMTLGSTEDIPEKRLEQFRVTGTLHLFSVSGLHVGMLGVLLWIGLKPLRLPFPAHVITIILLLFFYALVTGLRPASVRAAFMASVVLGGLLLSRPASPLNSLAAAGFFLLLANSAEVFNAGFQLSFGVVTAILILGVPLAKWIRDHTGPDKFLPRQLYGPRDKIHNWFSREVGALAAVSASAWMGSLPLIAANYHLISLSALPVNILAVPLAFVILAVAVLSLVTGAIFPMMAAIFNHTNVLVCGLLLGLIQFAASIPGGSFRVGNPLESRSKLQTVVFDFEAGASTAFVDRGKVWLADTGTSWDFENAVSPWLAGRGFSKMDGLFLSHGDRRHVGGAEDAVEQYRPGFVAVPPLAQRSPTLRRLYEQMDLRGLPRRLVFAGMQWELSAGWSVEILFPPADLQVGRADERLIVSRWTGNGCRILLASDADIAVQDWLLARNRDELRADVLVLGRSSAGEVPTQEFLEAVEARAIVVSVADFPRHEQFSPLWKQALQSLETTVFRQDETGAVLLEIENTSVRVRSFLSRGPQIEWETSREDEEILRRSTWPR